MYGKNVRSVNVYHKVSNLKKPFWGLTKNRLDQLKKAPNDYCVVLEHLGGKIILTSQAVDNLIKTKKVANDGDYKIKMRDLDNLH